MNNENREKELIQGFYSRDEKALYETQLLYQERLKRLAIGFLHDAGDAEECVNDALLKAWNQIPPYQPKSLYGYLARLVRMAALDKIDYRKARKRSMEIVELTREMEECLPGMTNEDEEDSDLAVWMNEFLGTLPEEKRFFFVRRYWYEDSIEQIAQSASCTKGKVKTSLHRTRESLRKYLERKKI